MGICILTPTPAGHLHTSAGEPLLCKELAHYIVNPVVFLHLLSAPDFQGHRLWGPAQPHLPGRGAPAPRLQLLGGASSGLFSLPRGPSPNVPLAQAAWLWEVLDETRVPLHTFPVVPDQLGGTGVSCESGSVWTRCTEHAAENCQQLVTPFVLFSE